MNPPSSLPQKVYEEIVAVLVAEAERLEQAEGDDEEAPS
jgi:hypothetical protein